MTLRFTLQLVARPPGKLLHCPNCGRMDFHPEPVLQVACPECSPFLAVRTDKARGRIEVVCRWAKVDWTINSAAAIEPWAIAQGGEIPEFVIKALNSYYEKHPNAVVRVMPPTAPAIKADVQIDQNGIVTMEAPRTLKAGDTVYVQNTPIGTAARAARAGELVEINLGRVHAPAKAPSPAQRFFKELAEDDER